MCRKNGNINIRDIEKFRLKIHRIDVGDPAVLAGSWNRAKAKFNAVHRFLGANTQHSSRMTAANISKLTGTTIKAPLRPKRSPINPINHEKNPQPGIPIAEK